MRNITLSPMMLVVMMMMLVMLTLLCPYGVEGVRITDLSVPAVALEGDEVHLRCDYEDEGGSSLYSLKWYKDDQEFFRHQPGSTSPGREDYCRDHNLYKVLGVTVNCWASTERDVVLKNVTRATSGEYQCEVIGEHPKFRKERREERLTIFSESLQAPQVLGAEDSYSLMDYVSLNCSSLNTEYTPKITWLVNGRTVNQTLIRDIDSRTTGLMFQVRSGHFHRGEISVACVTSLGSEHKMTTRLQLASRDGLSVKGYFYNAGQQVEMSRVILLLVPVTAVLSSLRTLASPAL